MDTRKCRFNFHVKKLKFVIAISTFIIYYSISSSPRQQYHCKCFVLNASDGRYSRREECSNNLVEFGDKYDCFIY
jgi:hypothetical protein